MALTDLITYQPFKGLWALSAISINAIRIPFWLLYYIPWFTRQHPKWTWRQAVAAKVLRTAVWNFSMMRVYTPLVLVPKPKEKKFFVGISPSSKPGAYTGICEDKQIKPVKICGYWYPSVYNADEDADKNIVLHFHGGAFVIGDCRPEESAYAAGLLTKHIGKTLMVSYRLSSNAGGRFPAALQDAVSALHYLHDLGVDQSNVVISGDSAGANVAISLLRYCTISDAPPFVAALLWSPWLDLAISLSPKLLYESPNRVTDYIPPAFAIWGANAYCPPDSPVKMDDAWISPGPNPFHTKTPVWVQGNDLELLIDQIRGFAKGMKGIEGNRIGYHNEENATHDILLVGNVTGFEKEAERAAKAAADWLNGL